MKQLTLSLDEPKPSPPSQKILSVSQLNSLIRGTLEEGFEKVSLQGEISNFKAYGSGHFYFSLKDDASQISAVMFRGFNSKLKFKPENGLEVIAQGKVTVYEPRGNYQLFCKALEPVGAGGLQLAFEQLKSRLQKEGLFAQEKKKYLPSFPKHIALITSPSGAAVRDMIQVLHRRAPSLQITVVPVLVQGNAAPDALVKGIHSANKISDIDLIIVGRGGGSVEDLWSFNEEVVARAIFESQKPIISAVGHEIDFTIADFVADLRAPTPSAAAELAVKNTEEVSERLLLYKKKLIQAQKTFFTEQQAKVNRLTALLLDPSKRIFDLSQRVDELSERLESSTKRFVTDKWVQLKNKMALMDSLSPLKVLDRGFALVKSSSDQLITNSSKVKTGDLLKIQMSKGLLDVKVQSVQKEK